MAKPKVLKVHSEWQLQDLYHSGKLESGQKVNFVVLKSAPGRRKKWKFCRGTFEVVYRAWCDCCGPFFGARVVGADGKEKARWGYDWW